MFNIRRVASNRNESLPRLLADLFWSILCGAHTIANMTKARPPGNGETRQRSREDTMGPGKVKPRNNARQR